MDSLTMSLMLVNGQRFDPIFDATLGPAMAWSVAHWLNVIPKEWIMLWKKMVRSVGGNNDALGSCQWPGGRLCTCP